MKKVLSLLLAVLMVFTLLPVSALADGEQLTIRASSVTALVASEIEVEISAENSDCHGATRWFRFDYYVCSYADYVRMYQYIKIEDGIESTSPVSASDTISNVQEWVLYREK